MKTKLYSLTVLFFSMTNCFAQKTDTTDISNLTKISFLNPGVSYEMRVGKFQSIYARGFMSLSGHAFYSSSFGFESRFSFGPALAVQYRYYYNAEHRKAKGKQAEINNMNYLSPAFETIFSRNSISIYSGNYKQGAINQLGLVWGIQRNYPRHFSLDLNLGPGWLFAKGTAYNAAGQSISSKISEFTIMSQFTLGFWLNKRK